MTRVAQKMTRVAQKMTRNTKQRRLQIFVVLFVTIVLLLQPICCESSRGLRGNYYRKSSRSSMRFNDFKPRCECPGNSGSRSADSAPYVFSQAVVEAARRARGFQLHTYKDDLKVDIEFVVPFVRIPVERSMEVARRALRNLGNLNRGSYLWTSVFATAGAVAVALYKGLGATTFANKFHWRKTRGAVTAWSEIMQLLQLIAKLHDQQIEVSACLQRSLCKYVRRAAHGVRHGRATALQKIVDGLLGLETVRSTLHESAVHEAAYFPQTDTNCERIFSLCGKHGFAHEFIEELFAFLQLFDSG